MIELDMDDETRRAHELMGLGQNAIGAIPINTKVVKINSETGDGNPDGTNAIVVGSMKLPDGLPAVVTHDGNLIKPTYVYFVLYPHLRDRYPIGIMDYKIKIDD